MGSIDNIRDECYKELSPSYYTKRIPTFKAYQYTSNMPKSIHQIFSKYGDKYGDGWDVTIETSSQDYRHCSVKLNDWIIIDENNNLVEVLSNKYFEKFYEPHF